MKVITKCDHLKNLEYSHRVIDVPGTKAAPYRAYGRRQGREKVEKKGKTFISCLERSDPQVRRSSNEVLLECSDHWVIQG
jgi:hypothetical protein